MKESRLNIPENRNFQYGLDEGYLTCAAEFMSLNVEEVLVLHHLITAKGSPPHGRVTFSAITDYLPTEDTIVLCEIIT